MRRGCWTKGQATKAFPDSFTHKNQSFPQSGRRREMKRMIDIRKGCQIGNGEVVLTPQSGMGILIAHAVTGTEPVDGGRFVEIATDDGRKHLVGKDDWIVVVFGESASKTGRMKR